MSRNKEVFFRVCYFSRSNEHYFMQEYKELKMKNDNIQPW